VGNYVRKKIVLVTKKGAIFHKCSKIFHFSRCAMPPGPTKKRAKAITKTALADKKYQVTPFDQLLSKTSTTKTSTTKTSTFCPKSSTV
jgi:hypothetical protein